MTHFGRAGFTLVETLVAAAVLATISTGMLATAWRLIGFAHDQVDVMVADAYTHDVLWAVCNQRYDEMLDGHARVRWTINNPTNALPRIEGRDIFGNSRVTYPLWRSQKVEDYPTCEVRIVENAASSNKTVTAIIAWANGVHSNVVVRSAVERK